MIRIGELVYKAYVQFSLISPSFAPLPDIWMSTGLATYRVESSSATRLPRPMPSLIRQLRQLPPCSNQFTFCLANILLLLLCYMQMGNITEGRGPSHFVEYVT